MLLIGVGDGLAAEVARAHVEVRFSGGLRLCPTGVECGAKGASSVIAFMSATLRLFRVRYRRFHGVVSSRAGRGSRATGRR